MKRKVERERILPAFSINILELEALWVQLQKIFEADQKNYENITIRLAKEQLVFDSLEELKRYANLKGRVSNFSLSLSNYGSNKHLTITSGYILHPLALVKASADSEAWCAGAVEIVFSFLQNHKTWYSFFVTAPLGWFFVALMNIPTLVSLILPNNAKIDKFLWASWIAITITVAIAYLGRVKFLPTAIIRFSDDESFVKKYGVEISLIIATISAILTFISLFLQNK